MDEIENGDQEDNRVQEEDNSETSDSGGLSSQGRRFLGIRERDSPGQQSVYIPSGDMRRELIRLLTFLELFEGMADKSLNLAASGFYYTGYQDQVKCFSCDMVVDYRVIGDDALELSYHKPSCKMASGKEVSNVPNAGSAFRSMFRHMQKAGDSEPIKFADILHLDHEANLRGANLRNELERRKTYEKWPSYPAPYLVSDLAKEGFFYLGNLDRAQCFSCFGVLRNWSASDSASELHRRHFPNCRIVRGEDSGNIPMSDHVRREMDCNLRAKVELLKTSCGEPPDPSLGEQHLLSHMYPCLKPMNPHMNTVEKRLETFDDHFPKKIMRASPADMARAGFYYLGDMDRTKCFYCNGGLQNWDPQDEPWTEHAKWFPECEFVMRKKGVKFVKRLLREHPNLNRPYIRNRASLDDYHINPTECGTSNLTSKAHQSVNLENIENIGVPQGQSRVRWGGGGSEDAEGQREDMNQIEDGRSSLGQSTMASTANVSGFKRKASDEVSTHTKSAESGMAKRLRKVEDSSLCRQCKQNKHQIVFLPCGHLCLCEICAANVEICAICRGRVLSKIRVYRA